MTVSFYGNGGETTGSVADRKIESAKKETTGGVGVRRNNESIFITDDKLRQDTVCFRGQDSSQKGPSTLGILLGTVSGIALAVGLMGLAHKKDWVGKINNEKVQKFFRHTDVVTEPCHKACSWVKKNCYDKVINFFHKK